MGYSFGKNSTSKLEECHKDLQKILQLAIRRSPVDFGISCGYRSIKEQKQLYDAGKSEIDGINKRGKHNHRPSLAADIYIYHPDTATRRKLAYDVGHLCMASGVIFAAADELLERGEISHTVRWGGNWDRDGIILMDQSFEDLPHFELQEP